MNANLICISQESLLNAAYVLSVALQLAAGLLLVGNIATSRKGIIDKYGEDHRLIAFYIKSRRLAANEGLIDVVKSSWINKLSFIYLSAGYLIGVFGEISHDRWKTLLCIIIITAVIWGLTRMWAKYASENFGTIMREDLPMDGGVGFVEIEDDENPEMSNDFSNASEYIVKIKQV